MDSSPDENSGWPKLRKILLPKSMLRHQYQYRQRPAPANGPPEIHIPIAIPWEIYTHESSSSQNPMPINGTQEHESANIFEKINKNLLGKILSPEMLFDSPSTNSDDNSNNEEENEETTSENKSSDITIKQEVEIGRWLNEETGDFILIDLASPHMNDITNETPAEPVDLSDEDICMPNVENDLVGAVEKRKPTFPCLNIVTESSIRIVPGGFKMSQDPRISYSGIRRSTEERLQEENKDNSSRIKDPRLNKSGNRRSAEENLQEENKDNSSGTNDPRLNKFGNRRSTEENLQENKDNSSGTNDPRLNKSGNRRSTEVNLQDENKSNSSGTNDPRLKKSGNRWSTEVNLQGENKDNSSRTKEFTSHGVSEQRTSSTDSVKSSKENFVKTSEKETVERANNVLSTNSSNKPQTDQNETNTGFNKQPAAKIKITFNEYRLKQTRKAQPDEKSAKESPKEKTVEGTGKTTQEKTVEKSRETEKEKTAEKTTETEKEKTVEKTTETVPEKTVEKTRETAQEKRQENQNNCLTSCPASPSPEITIIRNSSAELSNVEIEEMLFENMSSDKKTNETAAFSAKISPSVETTEQYKTWDTTIDKILGMGNDKQSNPEKNTSETMTFYSSNDQAEYNHSNGTVDGIPPLQANNVNTNETETDQPDDRFSIPEATAILRAIIKDKIRHLMVNGLMKRIIENSVKNLLENHRLLIDDIISRLLQPNHTCEKETPKNRNDRASNQEASPNLNPMEEINSENSPNSIRENFSPPQISQHQTMETHVLPPHQISQHQTMQPHVLPPHQISQHQTMQPHVLPPHQISQHQTMQPHVLPPHQISQHQTMQPHVLPPHQISQHQTMQPHVLPPHQISEHQTMQPHILPPHKISQHQSTEPRVLPPQQLPPTLPAPANIPNSPFVGWCVCRNPTCVNNQKMMANLQRMGWNGDMNSYPVSKQFPNMYSHLNNGNNGRGYPPNERQHNSNIPVNHVCGNNCHPIPPDVMSIPQSTQKRNYNKKRKADNETAGTKPAKRVRKPPGKTNIPANQVTGRRNSTESDIPLATAIDSFHDATSNPGGYSENNAPGAYSNPQESFTNQNYNYSMTASDNQGMQVNYVRRAHHPQQQVQKFPHFVQNQNSNAENSRGYNDGRPPMDFNLERMRPPPANNVQNRNPIRVSPPGIDEEQQQQSIILPSPIIPLEYVATSYDEPSQPETELRTDNVYQPSPPPNSTNFMIFESPAAHQKYLAEKQAHLTENSGSDF